MKKKIIIAWDALKYRTKAFFYTAFLVLLLIILFLLGKSEQEREADIIATGIETIGTVINRSKGKNPRQMAHYGIHFDFEHDGKIIVSQNSLYHNRWHYENAIIGMKYKVIYLPHAPQKNALIFIDKPIENEYVNIEKERERIFNVYESWKVNARSLDEIQHLIPNFPQ